MASSLAADLHGRGYTVLVDSPTIFDLANKLGLSKTTVADALNGTGRVSDSTRRRVHAAAVETGYVANASARRLRTRTGGMIALYIPADIRDMDFYMGFAFGAVDAAGRQGFDLAIKTSAPTDTSRWLDFDGLLVIDAFFTDPILLSMLDSGVPLAAAGHHSNKLRSKLRVEVAIDHRREISRVLDALNLAGSRRLAVIGADPRDKESWSSEVREGYLDWAAAHGDEPIFRSLAPFADSKAIKRALDEILVDPDVDGIIFGWQDAAERAQLILSHPDYADRRMKIGTYVSRNPDQARSRFDIALYLDPHRFGFETMSALLSVLRSTSCSTITLPFAPTLL